MDRDRNDRLEDLEAQVAKNSSTIDVMLFTQQARWEKSQGKFHAVYTRLNNVATNETRTFESLKGLRTLFSELDKERNRKMGDIQEGLKSQENKSGNIEKKTKKIEAAGIKRNSTVLIALALLFFLYIKEDIAAGKILDLMLTILAASGVTIYGIHSNASEPRE